MERKIAGPAYKDAAKRDQGNPEAAQPLIQKVRRGGGGVWGSMSMSANNVTWDEARKLVAWVLSR